MVVDLSETAESSASTSLEVGRLDVSGSGALKKLSPAELEPSGSEGRSGLGLDIDDPPDTESGSDLRSLKL